MYISKSRFINWTRCPMYFPMELKHNPTGKDDIDAERERREEILGELLDSMKDSTMGDAEFSEEDDEKFDSAPSPEHEALLPYYNQVENEALRVAKKYFHGSFISDSRNVQKQKLFEYKRNGHTYRCYVDIYNENENEINIIEVKATTNRKYLYWIKYNGDKKENKGLFFRNTNDRKDRITYPLFVKDRNFWHLNTADSTVSDVALETFTKKKEELLDRYSKVGKYPHDLAFQRFVIEHRLRQIGDNRPVNYYLAVLNSEYIYDGAIDKNGKCVYNTIDDQEIITFLNLNRITEEYQAKILEELAYLESYISTPRDVNKKVDVGKHCAWGENTECLFWSHCFQKLRGVPDTNSANKYMNSDQSFKACGIIGKYQLINEGYYKLDDVPLDWLKNKKHLIQRDCYDNGTEYVDQEKMTYWFDQLEYPIYHFDFEGFPCPLPRFKGESPYRQSVFEFSLHIEREPGVCDKEKDNFIFLNEEYFDDERKALAKAIVDHFEYNEDGSLKGTMLAQFTSYEKGRLEELAALYPEYSDKLLAIRDKSADLLHLLRNNEMYERMYEKKYGKEEYEKMKREMKKGKSTGIENVDIFNYYHKDLSGGYSIKKTLPVLVPSLTYKGMDVGNGVQAYIAYINYDSAQPTFNTLRTKADRREALKRYCQQDTWAMVEILRAVREKMK
ncbi:MAG: DUF2779 domain-containing protein [Paludibacteraceae bacterium]|nr:DUF2779 domain-containing protein [Paludibacteraceae bacterium]